MSSSTPEDTVSKERSFSSSAVSVLVLAALSVAVGLGIHYSVTVVLLVLALAGLAIAVRSRYAFVFIPLWAGVYLALAPRLILKVAGSGAGILPLAGLTTMFLAAIAVIGRASASGAARLVLKAARGAAVFTIAWALFPVLGLIMGYPVRTLAASIVPLTALAFLLLGAIGRLSDPRFWRVLYWGVLAAVSLGALSALLQSGALGSVLSPLASVLRQWDVQMMSQYGTPLLYARQSGLYVNPNTFALLGAFGLLYGFHADDILPFHRVAVATPSLAILVLSASRAVIIATVVAVALDLVVRLVASSGRLSSGRLAAIVGVAASALAAAAYIPERIASFAARMSSGFGAVTGDAAADSSVIGRLSLWRGALDHMSTHPLGTFGPPQLSLGASIDNEYLYMLVQGGIVLLALYVGALVGLYKMAAHGENPRFARSVIVIVLVSAISQSALTSDPAMIAVWLTTGASVVGTLGRSADGDRAGGDVPCVQGAL